MYLQLKQILPSYFEESRKLDSEIWGKELQFEKGEYIKIVAPSGSGKTSLMHFIYNIRKDYSGSIYYDMQEIKELDAEKIVPYRKKKISMVFQDLRLFPDQNVWNNINIKRQLDPFHPSEKIIEMMERLGIGSKANSSCKTCSYGEQQRIAIIRSLMQPFDFLLLDEPFSHLDTNNSVIAMELMVEEAGKRGASIIFADLERIDYFPFTKLFHL